MTDVNFCSCRKELVLRDLYTDSRACISVFCPDVNCQQDLFFELCLANRAQVQFCPACILSTHRVRLYFDQLSVVQP